ncbi:helix-turn-helix domain-containing protein [Cytobacillus firmus]|uniref:helix-turn-helix domain-containing protein n=1 Tax=Cytobacillus firmus TaxID=1399 RepID=UPI001C8F1570|nr:helix-turn-helix transcriptional regulator [Cytobacillus firmus]MBX9974208.1 helix-turn-helix transcriptional regulator [Cytobacillus firmus]
MDFKDYLIEKRVEKNLSINKLGELSGVSAVYISQIERGKRETPSPKILEKLADGLNEPYEDLMDAAGYIKMEAKDFTSEKKKELLTQEVQLDLNYLLTSNHQIFFQDRLLTKEEKAKIKSVIEIVLKD